MDATTNGQAKQCRTNGRAKPPTKAQLAQQLAEAIDRAERFEAVAVKLQQRIEEMQERAEVAERAAAVAWPALLANPATATPPPGGHKLAALQPAEKGRLRFWAMTQDNGYRVQVVQLDTSGCTWALTKWSDSTTYHVHEDDFGTNSCDCPGFVAHGPQCNGGQGCKHLRIIKAIRGLAFPAG